jgi:superfamily I DNA/RNA helicase
VEAIEQLLLAAPAPPDDGDAALVSKWVAGVAAKLIQEQSARDKVLEYLEGVIEAAGCTSVAQLLNALSMVDERMEQELDSNAINIMTMHKAKGLSADVVFVVAVEDEYIPGRAAADELLVGDELRLLYVSLTRARHRLYMTYCRERLGPQTHTGRTAGLRSRTLCRFLKNGPVHAESGPEYVRQLEATRGSVPGS